MILALACTARLALAGTAGLPPDLRHFLPRRARPASAIWPVPETAGLAGAEALVVEYPLSATVEYDAYDLVLAQGSGATRTVLDRRRLFTVNESDKRCESDSGWLAPAGPPVLLVQCGSLFALYVVRGGTWARIFRRGSPSWGVEPPAARPDGSVQLVFHHRFEHPDVYLVRDGRVRWGDPESASVFRNEAAHPSCYNCGNADSTNIEDALTLVLASDRHAAHAWLWRQDPQSWWDSCRIEALIRLVDGDDAGAEREILRLAERPAAAGQPDPVVQAWNWLGDEYTRELRYPEAIRAYRQALAALKPGALWGKVALEAAIARVESRIPE